ncbi:phytoene desaturase family protein [Streptomyces sp. 8L]|uniref:phytoene desaturase family protein n=1 Tax=Streptomyces sp. 8L TaxID=2877242 RepID=UPI001CD6FD24|nr:NAD(P)/FAD-dependent oxidoreductase [Streptomyces sp. 8L]MCA1217897.1 NAD(P)/FAD-dependent oxidoreductase [Streptomyces sp. 8L]
MSVAVVVGSGPNGLAAAVRLAQHGVRVTLLEAADVIGGGTRSSTRTVEGLLHDDCSAVHPLAVASPFFRSLALEEHGLRWLQPSIDIAHPLDDGEAGVVRRSLVETTAGMGEDGPAWRRLFGPFAGSFGALADEVLAPPLHRPTRPMLLARFGLRALPSASWTAARWKLPHVRALFAGIAAHAAYSLRTPLSSAVGLFLGSAAHAHGWPVAQGGSRSISHALGELLRGQGGVIETGVRVDSYDQLGRPDVVLLDTSPAAAAQIVGRRLPASVAAAYRRYRYGPGVLKVDFAVRDGVPWTNRACRRSGTVHVGGTFEEIARAERDVRRGVVPRAPFVLVGQQYLADPTRSDGDVHPVWAYAHVPHASRAAGAEIVADQIERFAPGFRKRVVATVVRTTRQLHLHNANYIGGDINGGANSPSQLLLRPRVAWNPYATGVPGVYLCSSSTPPGPGVHGMCGFHAANHALKYLGLVPAD